MAIALVTGASAGLGAELARHFARDGHDLVLVARRQDRLQALAQELEKKHGIAAHVVALDLGRPESVSGLVSELGRRGLEIEFLVNNAGFGTRGVFNDLEPVRELSMIDLNVRALVELTRALLPGMIGRGHGRILNLGSTAGFQPGPFMAVYYASKAFVNSFSEALSVELRGTGVSVTVSCPGPTATEFGAVAGSDRSHLHALGVASAESVALKAYRAMLAGRPLVVHGFLNKLAVQALRIGPRSLVRRITGFLNGDPKKQLPPAATGE